MYTSILYVYILGYLSTSALFSFCESVHKNQNDGINSFNVYQDLL